MSKITLSPIVNITNVATINANFEKIADEINNKMFSRNPEGEPNFLDTSIDLNSNRLLNVAAPVNPTDVVRLQDIEGVMSGDLDSKQDTLVSGVNIKTINNESILGSGNLDITAGTSDHNTLSNRGSVDQHPISAITGLQSTLDAKQPTLVSGSNIKTINGVSVLGSGDLVIAGGGTSDHSALTNRNIADQHTIAAVTGLQTSLDSKIASTEKGAANGVAPLGVDSKISATYLPSYVDDVLEYANLAAFPVTGEAGKIYVALDSNKTYRWSGSAYVEISPSPGSTDAVVEGVTNLYFTTARARTAAVANTITDGVNDVAPSQNAVFDALAGKQSTITVSTTAPVSPVLNQLWLDIT